MYWKTVFYALEDRFECWLLNAQHLRNVPGRKTDVKDSEWICQLVAHGLVRPSFVPPPEIRRLRDLTRLRKAQSNERTRAIQRLEKVLQDAGIKLTSVASQTYSKSARAMLEALLSGVSKPEELAELAKARMRSKIPQLREALANRFDVSHHGIMVAQLLAHIDTLEAAVATLDEKIDAMLTPHAKVALLVGWDVLPRDHGVGLGRKIDVLGSILATLGVMLAIYAVVRTEIHGIGSVSTIVPFVVGIALLIAFFALEWRITDPILPPRIISQRTLIVSCVVRAMMVVGLFTTFYLCSLYFENVRGWRPITTGLAFLPQTVIIAVFSLLITHRLVKRLGQRAVMFIGMALMAIGPLVLAIGLHANTPYAPGLLIPFALLGIGGGMCFIPLLHNGLAGVPDQDAGIASGLVNVSLQIGQAVGVALLGTIAAARTKTLQHNGLTAHAAATGGFRLAFWALTIAVAAGIALATRYLWAAPRQTPTGEPPNQ